ncbi:MDR family MFS transporter [Arcanobacterium wilhelmae]|uniref:MDR family MFS transporter n=1 Tax=Arcanobacterium wilhelmae TaxID=1803177 RepID=UPI0024158797|nr:MDR family MFS transporter [Arcanobacterium wilhelmae]WFN90989.1 MDR family MFS transporter [Arcanobacterium wilhelmae]
MRTNDSWSPLRDENTPVLFALMLANALIAMDATILATAVPSVISDLGEYSRFPWLFSIYLLTQAVTVPVYGKLADMHGRKPILVFGIVVFLLSSVSAGFATSMTSLIISRAIQGVGAGAVGPMAMTILGDIYTLEQRGKVQGYMASVWAVSSVIGPLLGGFFAEVGAWRGIFFVNVPFALLALILVWRKFADVGEHPSRRIDYLGAITMTVGLTSLVLGILEGGIAWPWLSWQTGVAFGVGVALLALMGVIEPRAEEPVVEFRLMKKRLIVATSLTMVSIGALTVGVTSFAPNFLQQATGISPILAGLAVAAMTLGWPLAGGNSAKLYLRRGFHRTIRLGAVIALIGSILLAVTVHWPSAWFVAGFAFILGLGLGFATAPSTIAAQNSVGWNQRAQVTAINTFARSIGSAVGVAVFGAVSNAVLGYYGGQATPASVTASTQAVFIGVVLGALAMLAGALLTPKDEPVVKKVHLS